MASLSEGVRYISMKLKLVDKEVMIAHGDYKCFKLEEFLKVLQSESFKYNYLPLFIHINYSKKNNKVELGELDIAVNALAERILGSKNIVWQKPGIKKKEKRKNNKTKKRKLKKSRKGKRTAKALTALKV